MEATPVVLMVLAICVGIPGVITLAVAGMYRVTGRRALRDERVKVLEQTIAVGLPEQPAEAGGETVAKEATGQRTSVA